nr:unnamed protein product [Callosobruchus analis]
MQIFSNGSIKNGSGKMPHWQVDDYGDLNADLENSLTLGSDLVNNTYSVSDTILGINGMTVFKQEAPSPTSTEAAVAAATAVVRGPQSGGRGSQRNGQSPTSTQHYNGNASIIVNSTMEDNNSQSMFNNTINQLLSQTALANLHNVMDSNNLSSPNSQDNYTVSSTNYNLIEDCRFQYVLAAATSIATKQNEDTLTYLNQGQSYEIKLKKLGDLSLYRGKLLKTIIRICFHERRLQYMEKEQMLNWQKARPGDRILEVDVPLSYGAYDINQPTGALNIVTFTWDPTKEVGVYIKVNCISTEFTPKKHGGEKGVPFRIQVETYQHGGGNTNNDGGGSNGKRLHAAACQIKVFKLKGADRKHKQDREKIMKRPLAEQEKYQPSCECTVLNDLPNDAILASSPVSSLNMENGVESTPQVSNQLAKIENGITGNQMASHIIQAPVVKPFVERSDAAVSSVVQPNQLSQHSTPDDTIQWLSSNRFEKYVDTFERFSGDDMLRMSRDDLIQICGDADGIRLHNALHSKTIAPKLKLYVCMGESSVYTAVFLRQHSSCELLSQLVAMAGVSGERVRDVYVEGPHAIHVRLTDDVLRHVHDEAMFSLDVVAQEGGGWVMVLKRATK